MEHFNASEIFFVVPQENCPLSLPQTDDERRYYSRSPYSNDKRIVRNIWAEHLNKSVEDSIIAKCAPCDSEKLQICRDFAKEFVSDIKQLPAISTRDEGGKTRASRAVEEILNNFDLLDIDRDKRISPLESAGAAQSKNETIRAAGRTLIANEHLDWDLAEVDIADTTTVARKPYTKRYKPGISKNDLELIVTAINGNRQSFNQLAKKHDVQYEYDTEKFLRPRYGEPLMETQAKGVLSTWNSIKWPFRWIQIQVENRDAQWQRLTNRVEEIRLPE